MNMPLFQLMEVRFPPQTRQKPLLKVRRMRRSRSRMGPVIILSLLLASVLSADAVTTNETAEQTVPAPWTPSNSELFLSAQTAYDEGRYTDAAALYEQLASNGVDNIELHYNLANARFKNGNLPEAVLNYRKAWYRAPRDPDIRANLEFALSAAGGALPRPSFTEKLFTILSMSEWIATAAVSYLALAIILILAILIRPARRVLMRLALLPTLLILFSAGGWWHWTQLKSDPEWVVVRTGTTALFGPIDGSTAHFKVPMAALVRQRDTDPKGWVEIEYDGKLGWLKREHIKRVYP